MDFSTAIEQLMQYSQMKVDEALAYPVSPD